MIMQVNLQLVLVHCLLLDKQTRMGLNLEQDYGLTFYTPHLYSSIVDNDAAAIS